MTDLAWEAAGDGERTLLLLHPGLSDRSFWDLAWPGLTTLGRAIRFDARAFGASPDPVASYSPADDAVAVLDAAGAQRAVLVGVSFGSRVALDVAVAHPERVEGLVLVSGPGDDDEDLEARFDEVDAAIERGDLDAANELEVDLWAAKADPAVRDWVRAQNRVLLGRQPQIEHEPALLEPEATGRLDEVAAPVLVLLGEHDQPSAMAGARAVAAGTGAEVVVLPGAGHLLGREQPEAFVAALRRWLA